MQETDDKGFALFDEATAAAREDLAGSGDLNDFFVDPEASPSELLEKSKELDKESDDPEELSDLDLSPGSLDKSNDSVRVYLREMGMVPLLTREGEIELAKRIERGQNAVRKALSRSRLVVQIVLDTRNGIERAALGIFDVLQAPDAQGTEDANFEEHAKQEFFEKTREIEKLF